MSTESASTAGRGIGARLRFLITPRWIILIVSVLVFSASAYLVLAPWQLSRNAEREAQNAAIASAVAAEPAPIEEVMSLTAPPARADLWHRVTVTGTFDAAAESYIRLRQDNNGQPAFEVVVPLLLPDGNAVLVDRGYVPFQDVEQGVALSALPSGEVTVTGRVQDNQTDPMNRPPIVGPDGRTQYTAISSTTIEDRPAYIGYLQLTEESPAVLDAVGLPLQDSGPFLSYALQWFGFGAVAVIGIGFFIYREFSDPSDGSIYADEIVPSGPEPAASSPAAAAARAADTVAPARAAHAPPAPAARRRRGQRFDKSQLYDAP